MATPQNYIVFTPQGSRGTLTGARWSVSGGTFAPGEFLGFYDVSDGFTIDTGPRTFGWASPGGPAAPCTFTVMNAAAQIVATATLAASLQTPVINILIPQVPSFSHLGLYAPASSDLNLNAFSLTLAAA